MQGLLQVLALPVEAGSDTGGAALPALGALSDVLEHMLAQQRGERGAEEQEEGGMHGGGTRWVAALLACSKLSQCCCLCACSACSACSGAPDTAAFPV